MLGYKKMLTLKQWMDLIDYRITDGGVYYSDVGTLYALTSWNGAQDGYSLEVMFDPDDNQKVYMVQVCDFKRDRAYRIMDSSLVEDKTAWENVDWVDLETDEDFIEKAKAIMSDEDYDTRVSIPLDLEDSEVFELMKMAHGRDMTLNQFVQEIVSRNIDLDK